MDFSSQERKNRLFCPPDFFLDVTMLGVYTKLAYFNTFTNFHSLVFLLSSDTRETAFVHSITSAGVTYALTRDCRIGKFKDCACVNNKKIEIQSKDSPQNWRGGCSENTKYGEVMGKHFLEAIDIENAPAERKRLISHNNDIGRKVLILTWLVLHITFASCVVMMLS